MNPYKFYSDQVRSKEIIIGSSDIPVIIKTNGSKIKKTAYQLWQEKRGECDSFTGNDKTRWGHKLEPLLIETFIEQTGDFKTAYQFLIDYILNKHYRDITSYNPPTQYHPFTECRHPKFPWAVAHSDCIFTGKNPYNIEAKTGGYFARVKREGMEGFDLDDHTINGVPTDIILQVQWQMFVYDINMTYVLLLVDDNNFHTYEVPAIKKWWPFILEKASLFYNCCITGEKPQPENFEDVKKIFPEVFDRAKYILGNQALIAEQMKAEKKTLQERIKKYNARIDDINDAAGILMGDNKFLINGETTETIFQQVISENQLALIHPSTIKKNSPEAYKILEQKGLIKKYNRRYVL